MTLGTRQWLWDTLRDQYNRFLVVHTAKDAEVKAAKHKVKVAIYN